MGIMYGSLLKQSPRKLTINKLDPRRCFAHIEPDNIPTHFYRLGRTGKPFNFFTINKSCQRCIFYLAFQRHIGSFIRCPSDEQVTGFPHDVIMPVRIPRPWAHFQLPFTPQLARASVLVNILSSFCYINIEY